jgi:chorismate dehydratase
VADLPPGPTTRSAPPSALAALLDAREVDAALLPVAEAFRGAGDGFLGSHGIGCDGAVESVLAFLPRPGPPPTWPRRVVLDPSSRTSVALLRLLLERRHGLRPEYETADAYGPDPAARPDAMTLVIGDRALHARRAWRGGIVDLGLEWREWTGLPFVFARWTARAGLSPDERAALARLLDDAAQSGISRREALARERAPAHGLSPEEAVRWLGSSLRFEVDARAEAGLARFREMMLALEGPR